MKINKALVVLNGAPCSSQLAGALSLFCDATVCVDGAYNWFGKTGLDVDIVAGDLDSLLIDLPAGPEIIKLEDQDYTDFEKVVTLLISRGFAELHIIGSTGKEDDHFLSNLMVLGKSGKQIKMIMYDDQQRIEFIRHGKFRFAVRKQTIVSVFGWPTATFKQTEGLLYPLDGLTLDFNQNGSRNQATGDFVNVELLSGTGLLFIKENPLAGIKSLLKRPAIN